MLTETIAQIPARYRRDLLITADGAGASHGLVEHISTLNARPGYRVYYSIGWELGARERAAIARVPARAWGTVLDTEGQPRDPGEAGVVEVTALLRQGPAKSASPPPGPGLSNWPPAYSLPSPCPHRPQDDHQATRPPSGKPSGLVESGAHPMRQPGPDPDRTLTTTSTKQVEINMRGPASHPANPVHDRG